MDRDDYARLVEAGRTLCEFCENNDDCEKCQVTALLNDAANELDDEDDCEDDEEDHKQILIIPGDVAAKIQQYLEADSAEEYQSEDEPISYTAWFKNDIRMEVMCYGNQNEHSWAQAILFSHGCEVCCSAANDMFFKTWSLTYNGITYEVETITELDFNRRMGI